MFHFWICYMSCHSCVFSLLSLFKTFSATRYYFASPRDLNVAMIKTGIVMKNMLSMSSKGYYMILKTLSFYLPYRTVLCFLLTYS